MVTIHVNSKDFYFEEAQTLTSLADRGGGGSGGSPTPPLEK